MEVIVVCNGNLLELLQISVRIGEILYRVFPILSLVWC
jgi:hypothetical protein